MMIIYRSDWLALGGETTVKMVLLFLFLPPPPLILSFIFSCVLCERQVFISSCPHASECVCVCHCCLRPPFRVIVVGCVISQRDDTWVSVSVSFPPRRALLQLVSGDLSLLPPPSPTTPLFFFIVFFFFFFSFPCVCVCVQVFLKTKTMVARRQGEANESCCVQVRCFFPSRSISISSPFFQGEKTTHTKNAPSSSSSP